MQKINTKHLASPRRAALEPSLMLAAEQRSYVAAKKQMSPALAYILQEAQRDLGYEWQNQEQAPAGAFLEELVERVSARLGFTLSSYERDEVLAHLEKDQQQFGILQDLVNDQSISDIIVTDYSKITVQQGRKNLVTDLTFSSQESYESFVERLLQRAQATYSTKKPIVDGMIGAFARIHAVHRCLCETGPYLTIRLNRFPTVALADLIKLGAAPKEVFDYLRAIIRSGQTVLIVGEVGTGKTTLVRALASSMPEHESILVIEDTPEIRLEHPHVRYISTREENTDGAGRISPSECIRAGMRMAMNRIIFGEMRDAEAAEAFVDVCASGHAGLSTIHARSGVEAISRLELFLGRAQKGVSRNVIYEQIAKAVQIIIFVDICPQTGKRRIFEVKEIGPVADGVIRQRDIFTYACEGERPVWRVVNKISAHRDELESAGVSLSEYPMLIELENSNHRRALMLGT